ncbi:hypothetical protein HMPREF9714_00955 [Myroides odoratimimus CCUG 12901]|uniref:RagB/SusD family nutrient uptake outer membrane protein n=1 Tax=Myroides TaxID=76831 RepID=UPI0002460D4F|nr:MULTISPECIES: RagB/SusD family nutrient uptake outer membrane protein [Myroides]EHO13121.1 hypothetical protein HMPREF9714_00955 [Myroides odoratimimus CCUG 12901]MDX4974114.1 RagB/SusD family nutrient uptake outer membrane protein [Myroides odoratimimus]
MKKHIITQLLFLILLILTTSCESMIEVDLPENKINEKDVYQNISTTKAVLSTIYSNIRDKFFLSKNSSGLAYGLSLYTDELDYLGTSTNDLYLNTINADNNSSRLWWDNAYQSIYTINAFINGVSQSSAFEKQIKNQLLGEAYTLRALHYQYLIQLYGDIPYTTSTDYIFNTSIYKTPYHLALIEIEKDLLHAVELLSYEYRDNQRFYVNKAVAELLLVENYLLQKKYSEAESLAQKLVYNSLYNIEMNLDQTFKKTAKSTLWQISPLQNSAATPEANLYLFTSITPTTTVLSKKLIDSFDTNDMRFKHWIKEVKSNESVLYGVYKYKNKTNNTDEYSVFFRIEQANFLLAESLYRQDKISEAVQVINTVRIKRGLNGLPLNITKQEFETQYLTESNKEFFTESGHRFFTLKRLEKLQILKDTKPNWREFHQLFPIPEKQLLINKNLNPQNNGY